MRKIKTIKPRGEAGRTVATLYDDGITYNETGVTFNDAIAYGGIYNYGMDNILSVFVSSRLKKIADNL